MSKRSPAPKRTDKAAVVISSACGEVIEQNSEAVDLLGDGVGLDCWQLVGVRARGDRMPCQPGCTRRLVEEGCDGAQSNPVVIEHRRYQLSCTAVGTSTVSTLSPIGPPQTNGNTRRLTTREVEVLELLARGFTVDAAADELGISERTVRTHIEHMRSKLNVSSQAALVAQGYERGYLG
jgi:DNA-binding CsgD family transcriptional regulator